MGGGRNCEEEDFLLPYTFSAKKITLPLLQKHDLCVIPMKAQQRRVLLLPCCPPLLTKSIMSNEQLTSVFTRLRRQLLGTARTLLTERETAEDVLQDAFVRLWGRTESHEMDDGQMAALASTTVRNLCIDRLRQEKKRETVFDEFTMAQAHQLADDEESNREELLSAVERLVTQELTPLQQRLFQRREVDGASYALLAREEGMEETAIRMQLSRARKKIRNIYLHQNQSSV